MSETHLTALYREDPSACLLWDAHGFLEDAGRVPPDWLVRLRRVIIDSLASRRGVLHPAADALLARCEPAIMAGNLPDWAEEEASAVYPQLGPVPADRCSWEHADHMASVAALLACRAHETPRPFKTEAVDVQIPLDEAAAPVEDVLRAFRRHYPGGYLGCSPATPSGPAIG